MLRVVRWVYKVIRAEGEAEGITVYKMEEVMVGWDDQLTSILYDVVIYSVVACGLGWLLFVQVYVSHERRDGCLYSTTYNVTHDLDSVRTSKRIMDTPQQCDCSGDLGRRTPADETGGRLTCPKLCFQWPFSLVGGWAYSARRSEKFPLVGPIDASSSSVVSIQMLTSTCTLKMSLSQTWGDDWVLESVNGVLAVASTCTTG